MAGTVAILASLAGLSRRVAIGWAIAGLALGLGFTVPFALVEPATVGAFVIPTAAVAFAVTQWR